MKKLLLSLLLIFPQIALADPTIVKVVTVPTVDSAGTITQLIMRLPSPLGNNNGAAAVTNSPSGFGPTNCTDDKSVAWTASVTRSDGSQVLSTFYTTGRTDGPQILTCTFGTAKQFISGAIVEFAGVALSSALDKTCGDSFLATETDCSTAATTQAGELILAFHTQTDVATTLVGWTAGTGYTLIGADNFDSTYVTYQIQAATGVAQPLINMDASRHGITVALTFKPAAQGTIISGMVPVLVQHIRFKTTDTAPIFNVPCVSGENSIIGIWNGAAGRIITGTAPAINITSTGTTGTWKQKGSGSVSGGSGKNQYVYLENGSCSSITTVTPTFSGGQALESWITWITFPNGATTLADPVTEASVTGNDLLGLPFSGSSITATNAGYAIAYIGAATGSGSQVVCSPAYFIHPQTVPVIDTNPVGENQGACLIPVTASQVVNITWTPNSKAIGTYADYLAVFNSAGGGGGGATTTITIPSNLMKLLR